MIILNIKVNNLIYIYNTFLQNIENSGHKDKIIINRGYSHSILHNFKDNFFDIIYIDGNHEPDYVYQDAILSFKKLKHGGVLIFDDYTFSGDGINSTKTGIDRFVCEYLQKIEKLGYEEPQIFITPFDISNADFYIVKNI